MNICAFSPQFTCIALVELNRKREEVSRKCFCSCSVSVGYQPKTGFLQSQIKRLPMLYDDEYMDERPPICDSSDNTSLEELAMP